MARSGATTEDHNITYGAVNKTKGGYYVLCRSAPLSKGWSIGGAKAGLLWPVWASPDKTRAEQTG